jgi:hypothetical protein
MLTNLHTLSPLEIIINPLSQFEIRDLLVFHVPLLNNLHFSFTNIVGYLSISFIIITLFNSMTQKHANVLYKN